MGLHGFERATHLFEFCLSFGDDFEVVCVFGRNVEEPCFFGDFFLQRGLFLVPACDLHLFKKWAVHFSGMTVDMCISLGTEPSRFGHVLFQSILLRVDFHDLHSNIRSACARRRCRCQLASAS